MEKRILAFDFGASSGRAMLSRFEGNQLKAEEIHRFSNDPVVLNGVLYWDIVRMMFEIKRSISLALAKGGFDAIGIDTWGVDFGLLDRRGNLMQNPVHYRDPHTVGVPEQVFKIIPKEEIYEKTGIQLMRFNTLYQLYYLAREEPALLAQADRFLLMPDLMAYFLTGEKKCEVTNASTTNLYNPTLKGWDFQLCRTLGIPTEIFPPIISTGEIYGNLLPEICEELNCPSVPVVAVATHDTASAVFSCPAKEKDFVYISCGTWSLFGTELGKPIMSEKAIAANFTNEIGYHHSVRFLKNIMGLWLIQESRRQWMREGSEVGFDVLENEALESRPFQCYIDTDAPQFETPGNLPRRIQEYCERTGQTVPQTRGETMRCIYQSIAMRYKYTFETLSSITGKKYKTIHMFGGGIKDTLLCKMTASACGVPVYAGPVEATVMGNIGVACLALGEIRDHREARKIIRESNDIKVYQPLQWEEWQEAYGDFLKAAGLKG